MRDFYAASGPAPWVDQAVQADQADQAQGLRQLFAGRPGHARQLIALAANPHVTSSAVVLDRLSAGLSRLGRQVLVVDAAASAPAPHELARLDLVAGIEPMLPGVAYLPARGLPLQYVDTRGSAARFVEAVFDAVPSVNVVLLHAEAADLARVLARRAARPLLLAADHPESLKHAYASCKLLLQRTGLATFDLVLAASARSPRLASIAASLRGVADGFLGALVNGWALVDPAARDDAIDAIDLIDPIEASGALALERPPLHRGARTGELAALLTAQLALDIDAPAAAAAAPARSHPLPRSTRLPTDRG